MVLVLEHRQVVPNLNFETPNPKSESSTITGALVGIK